jgi:hypothetical protein
MNEEKSKLDMSIVSKRYFIIRRYNCCTSADTTDVLGLTSDILGLTTDEEYAKSRVSLFCDYEEVKMIP